NLWCRGGSLYGRAEPLPDGYRIDTAMSLIQDLRFACRLILKEKWYAAVTVLALSLGIGVNATGFTLVNAGLIRGVPVRDSGQLYTLGSQRATDSGNNGAGVSAPDLADWRTRNSSFEGLAAFSGTNFNIADDHGLPEQVQGALLSGNAFQLLGQQPMVGR